MERKKELLDIDEERISELEDKSEWITENSVQRNKDMGNVRTNKYEE